MKLFKIISSLIISGIAASCAAPMPAGVEVVRQEDNFIELRGRDFKALNLAGARFCAENFGTPAGIRPGFAPESRDVWQITYVCDPDKLGSDYALSRLSAPERFVLLEENDVGTHMIALNDAQRDGDRVRVDLLINFRIPAEPFQALSSRATWEFDCAARTRRGISIAEYKYYGAAGDVRDYSDKISTFPSAQLQPVEPGGVLDQALRRACAATSLS